MRILTVNAGSSSLKVRVIGDDDVLLAEQEVPHEGGSTDRALLAATLAEAGPIEAVGHRVVHGGSRFRGPVRITDDLVDALDALTPLAPLHQPAALDGIAAVQAILPDVPAVACFDTAFHADLPAAAATYAVPHEWSTRHGLRRYGFHGLSHAYVSRRTAQLVGRPIEELRIVTCHLGAGASLAAVAGGRSIDTTMGFTPAEGLVMATRSGNVDPGLLLWLLEQGGHEVREVSDALEHGAGLRGMTGTADMREVLERAGAGDEPAVLARDVYVHRLRALIAAMAAALDGVDALAFTGGVGERSGEIRRRAADGLGFLGVAIDPARNTDPQLDADITAPSSRVRVVVVRTREDLEIARGVRAVLRPNVEP